MLTHVMDPVQPTLRTVISRVILPILNKKLEKGFPLPVLPAVDLENADIRYEDGFIFICSDVYYRGGLILPPPRPPPEAEKWLYYISDQAALAARQIWDITLFCAATNTKPIQILRFKDRTDFTDLGREVDNIRFIPVNAYISNEVRLAAKGYASECLSIYPMRWGWQHKVMPLNTYLNPMTMWHISADNDRLCSNYFKLACIWLVI